MLSRDTAKYGLFWSETDYSHKAIRSCVSTETPKIFAAWASLFGNIPFPALPSPFSLPKTFLCLVSTFPHRIQKLWERRSWGWALQPWPSSQRSKFSAQNLKVIMQKVLEEKNWCNPFPQHLNRYKRPLLATDITYTKYTRAQTYLWRGFKAIVVHFCTLKPTKRFI